MLQTGSLVASVLEALAGGELRHVAGRNIDFLAGLRIAALGGFATRHGEIAKTDEANVATIFQLTCDGFKKTASTADVASPLLMPDFSATAATSSFLFIFVPFLALCRLSLFDAVILRISRFGATKTPRTATLFTRFSTASVTKTGGKFSRPSKSWLVIGQKALGPTETDGLHLFRKVRPHAV